MKTKLLLFLALVSPALALGPTTTNPESAASCTLTFNVANGVATSVVLTVFYTHTVTLNSNGAVVDTFPSSPTTCSVDFVAQAANTVCTYNAVNYTGAQVQGILASVAATARTAQGGPF